MNSGFGAQTGKNVGNLRVIEMILTLEARTKSTK